MWVNIEIPDEKILEIVKQKLPGLRLPRPHGRYTVTVYGGLKRDCDVCGRACGDERWTDGYIRICYNCGFMLGWNTKHATWYDEEIEP